MTQYGCGDEAVTVIEAATVMDDTWQHKLMLDCATRRAMQK